MPASFMEKLRSARKIEWLALLVAIALLALILQDTGALSGTRDASTELEERLERVLSSVEGAGEVRAMVTEDENGGVVGVLVVAQGAGDIAVRLKLAQAVKALLGVDLNRIEVVKMNF